MYFSKYKSDRKSDIGMISFTPMFASACKSYNQSVILKSAAHKWQKVELHQNKYFPELTQTRLALTLATMSGMSGLGWFELSKI